MAFKIDKLKKKIDKIISKNELGATLTMETYVLSGKDIYENETKALESTFISSGAKIGGSGEQLSDEGFFEESLVLIVPYDLDVNPIAGKLKTFTFMSKVYIVTKINLIDGIQDSGAGNEVTFKRYREWEEQTYQKIFIH